MMNRSDDDAHLTRAPSLVSSSLAHEPDAAGGQRATNLPSPASVDGERSDRQRPHGARQRSERPPAGRAPADGTPTPEKHAHRPEQAAPNQGGGKGVKITGARPAPFRDATEPLACTELKSPLAFAGKGDTPSVQRTCGVSRCGASLDGMSDRALYCSRRHKEAARRFRNRREPVPGPRTAVCSVCGATVAVTDQRGRLPTYCAEHHPKQPCAGCGKTLRHRAVSQFCRSCQAIQRPTIPERVWTRLCDVCGAIFEGPPSANLCDTHTTTKEDRP